MPPAAMRPFGLWLQFKRLPWQSPFDDVGERIMTGLSRRLRPSVPDEPD